MSALAPSDFPPKPRGRRHLQLVHPRAKTENMKRTKIESEPVEAYERPRTRGECVGGERPCPFVGCRHHLYLDISKGGNVKFNFPGVELEDLAASCSLDVAGEGGISTERVGILMNITRERVRQIEVEACGRHDVEAALREYK